MNKNTYNFQPNIHISDFDYDLPDSRIAKYPLEKRDASKLLIYQQGAMQEGVFSDLPSCLKTGDLLVVNNTKVIYSRLIFQKITGALIEIFCLEPYSPSDHQLSLQSVGHCSWLCLAGNLKKWKEGSLLKEIIVPEGIVKLEAKKIKQENHELIIGFTWDLPVSFAHILEYSGETPIPPYLNRTSESIDKERYQTVYCHSEGSVAAPTAGLHFTTDVFDALSRKDIHTTEVTLHVGAGTFKPVQTALADQHEMHSEFFSVNRKNLEWLLKNKDRVAVGTTSLRTLESLYWLAVLIRNNTKFEDLPTLNQWDAYQYQSSLNYSQAIEVILEFLNKEKSDIFSARTKIMILPGYDIKSVRALVTNFHQPKSTLLLLVCAFIGKDWKKVYEYALSHDFRFLSYGDSSVLFRD